MFGSPELKKIRNSKEGFHRFFILRAVKGVRIIVTKD
ncbi:MAG: hypothetical protein US90_C0004G0004 [Candidatus Shapirobacteria bacterium GW2011_GWE2_38_30]|uniref:Uncharacterized protein n=1 Tax=Candidatus Shapirobacteria bacterium GW2011_GWE2_38_30 TaxID=1618490 RepID=A0A0G0JWP8_9BACT|nr:MAG: hypothetical protein US90_C0004G0004 [Candidatus Shapirobacteria bacterium GW2011_GWE2_38_30]